MLNPQRLFAFLTVLLLSIYLKAQEYSLKDYLTENEDIRYKVDSIFNSLDDTGRVAQTIISSIGKLGKDIEYVKQLIKDRRIGGVNVLGDEKENQKKQLVELSQINTNSGAVPLLYSMDAEPSLLNSRSIGSQYVKNTNEIIDSNDCIIQVTRINNELIYLGIKHNYAPVCDVSLNNTAIKNRSFGSDYPRIISLSNVFINETHKSNILATAKHFPGHGLVKGDTHKQKVFIDGSLKELSIYEELIENGVLSIMVAHLTIINNDKYNTGDIPATCSKKIITGLLKSELGFKGIIITDALGMQAAKNIEDMPLKASMAGCDILLMPEDEEKTLFSILAEMEENEEYKYQVYESVKKILRMKVCLGLI